MGSFAVLCLALTASAAVAAPDADRRLEFDHLLPEHGLSTATLYSLLQDRRGFLWIGTEDGLNRFDGHRFETFHHDPNDPGTLASNDVSFILEDREGAFWLATWGGGLDRFDPATMTFHHFRRQPADQDATGSSGLQDDRVQHLLEDSAGALWIGTFSGGLSRLDRESGTFETFRHDPKDPASLSHDRIWRILEDPSGTLWIATGKGLCVFDRATESFVRYRHVQGDPLSLSDDEVRTLYVDRAGTLWIGTGKGLNRVSLSDAEDGRARSFERFLAAPDGLSHDVVTALFEDSRGTFWVGTRGGGLNILDRATGRWRSLRHDPDDPFSLSDDDVRAISEDRTGVLWIATRHGGLNKLDLKPAKFERLSLPDAPDSLASRRIRAFAEDAEGRLWIGTARGVWRYDPREQRYDHFRHDPADAGSLPSNDVHGMLITRAGELWLAGRTGLHRMVSGEAGFITYRHDDGDPRSLAADLVTALYEDGAGNLWIGTVSGLDRLDLSTLPRGPEASVATGHGGAVFEHYRHRPGDPRSLSENFITALLGNDGGTLWVGTHNGGLNRCDTVPAGGSRGEDTAAWSCERSRHDPRDPTSLSSDRIETLYQQESGVLWIGTVNGLNQRLPDGTYRRYLAADGLPNAQVAGMLGAGEGQLWIATGAGLARFDPAGEIFRNYTTGDGLPADPFNPGAHLRRRDGRLCFGGNSGYTCFDPECVVDNPHPPAVVLTGFEKLGESVSFDRALWAVDNIRLPHQDNFFSFEVAALDYTSPQDQLYSYLLEGFDREWSEIISERTASYANVPPGRYVFRARGTNGDAVWSASDLTVALVITPPFWQTWWFRGLTILALAAAGGTGYNFRVRHLKRREQELSRRLGEGLADLRRSERRYRLLFERNLAGVVRATVDGKIVECNDAFSRILGYGSPSECQERHLLALDAPGASGSLLASLRASGTVVAYENSARAKDGSMVSLLWNASLISDSADDPAVIEGTVIDLSERQRIEEGLRRTQKLESLGVLAGGIAHDYNNLLMSILGNAELGRIGLDPDSKVHQRLAQIETAAQRGSELSQQMLAYSGKGELVVSFLDISSEVQSRAHLLEGAVSKKARIVYALDPSLPTIEADAGQIEQIVMSLLTNASEALRSGGGTIVIATGSRECSREELADTYLAEELPAGEYVFLEVADDGCGMDEEIQLKIFDPFFTTKFTGRGLGLAAVLGIVRGHRGAILIDSAPGRGSTFTVLFPAAERPSRTDVMRPVAAPAPGEGIVLIVDDDDAVRQVASDMVEALGLGVVTAVDGFEGLEVFRRQAGEITLVLLDLAMPRMGGEETFHAIREISPEARVILASGYDEKESRRLFSGQGLSGFIQKPYRLGALRDKIQEALGGEWGGPPVT